MENFYRSFSFLKYCPSFLKPIYEYSISVARLKVSPEEIFGSSTIVFIVLLFISFLFGQFIKDLFYGFLLLSFIIYIYLLYWPIFYREVVRMNAVTSSIWIILYLVLYLKRNPNLESAFYFVAQYCKGPIAEDFREIIYYVEEEKFYSLEEAIKYYSKRWLEWNPDFVYAINMILSIRYMRTKEEIDRILDRTLKWIMDRAYKKTKKYALDLKQPAVIIVTFLIMLPLISLIMVPVITIFLIKEISYSFLAFSYVALLPTIVFLVVRSLLSRRPYASYVPDLSLVKDLPPEGFFRYRNRLLPALLPAFVVGFLIMLPGLYHILNFLFLYFSLPDPTLRGELIKMEHSIGAILITFMFVLGLALGIGLYFYLKSFQKVKRAKEIEDMEEEFPLVLYQLGNILEQGFPIETTFIKAYENYKILMVGEKSKMLKFFEITIRNLYKGFDIKTALFSDKVGALEFFPSRIIREVMKLLITSVKEGPKIASQVAFNIANHLENINDIKYKIKETLSEILSMLKSTAAVFLPIVGGIVIVFNKALLSLLWSLVYFIRAIDSITGTTVSESIAGTIIKIFNLYEAVPPTFFVPIIGIFFIEATLIVSYFVAGMEYGFNKTMVEYYLGKYLLQGIIILTIMVVVGITLAEYMFGQYIFLK